jgi:hypothetical protein
MSNGGIDPPDRRLNVGRDAARPESVLFGMLRRLGGQCPGTHFRLWRRASKSRRPISPCRNARRTGSRVPSFAKPRLTMYAAATHEAYRQPSLASRSASPTYTAIKMATMAAIASMNSDVLNPPWLP